MAALDYRRKGARIMVPPAVVPGFHEDWFSPASCDALAALVERVANVPGLIVEFGSWEGRSTCALANAAYPRTVDAVDTWAGSPGEVSSKLASLRDVFGQWQANVKHYTRGNVVPYVMDWRDYCGDELGDGDAIALAFIDATHTYEEVRAHVSALLPFMAEGGILCGDDVHHPPIRQALAHTLGDRWQTAASLWWASC